MQLEHMHPLKFLGAGAFANVFMVRAGVRARARAKARARARARARVRTLPHPRLSTLPYPPLPGASLDHWRVVRNEVDPQG